MAQVESAGTEEHPRHIVKLEPGERVALCRCFASEKFPFCDGHHRELHGRGPVVVVAEAPQSDQSVNTQ